MRCQYRWCRWPTRTHASALRFVPCLAPHCTICRDVRPVRFAMTFICLRVTSWPCLWWSDVWHDGALLHAVLQPTYNTRVVAPCTWLSMDDTSLIPTSCWPRLRMCRSGMDPGCPGADWRQGGEWGCLALHAVLCTPCFASARIIVQLTIAAAPEAAGCLHPVPPALREVWWHAWLKPIGVTGALTEVWHHVVQFKRIMCFCTATPAYPACSSPFPRLGPCWKQIRTSAPCWIGGASMLARQRLDAGLCPMWSLVC